MSLFFLAKESASPKCASQPMGLKSGRGAAFGAWLRRCWARFGRGVGLQSGVFSRVGEMACLPASSRPGVSIWGHLVFTFLPCTTARTTARKSCAALYAQDQGLGVLSDHCEFFNLSKTLSCRQNSIPWMDCVGYLGFAFRPSQIPICFPTPRDSLKAHLTLFKCNTSGATGQKISKQHDQLGHEFQVWRIKSRLLGNQTFLPFHSDAQRKVNCVWSSAGGAEMVHMIPHVMFWKQAGRGYHFVFLLFLLLTAASLEDRDAAR